jgi:hypothetical protein
MECIEVKRLTKDGRTIDVSLTISPIQDAEGKVIAVSTVIHDLTHPKRQRAKRHRLAAVRRWTTPKKPPREPSTVMVIHSPEGPPSVSRFEDAQELAATTLSLVEKAAQAAAKEAHESQPH